MNLLELLKNRTAFTVMILGNAFVRCVFGELFLGQ